MSYRVLIPTAGTGSRLEGLTKYVNKSLVGIANRPTISHIIEQFPPDVEFVIALGHKGHLVKEFLQLAYPHRLFYFSEVDPFEGPGSGLGLSILSCKKYLQQPFVFTSCDTLVREPIPSLQTNWMGYAESVEIGQYRTIEIHSGIVKSVNEKGIGKGNSDKPYIGLAGIKDYELFWDAMEEGGEESIAMGEAYGMNQLLSAGIQAKRFTWFDTGNIQSLEMTRNAYRQEHEPNILEKADEAIWFVDDQVIKFSNNTKFISNRVERAAAIKEFIPNVTDATEHMYKYVKASGDVLSNCITIPLFEKFLYHSLSFWKLEKLDNVKTSKFRNSCMRFYKDKSFERVDLFYKNFGKNDGKETINGFNVPTLQELLDTIDWNWLADGLPGRFHGDFHFENILYSDSTQQFTFLDWRQEFDGSLTTGDIYYDLAKLLHGLIISHKLIVQDHYWIDWQNDAIRYDFHRKQILVECERYFYEWLKKNNFDVVKVKTLTALVYLNIAALHHDPYCKLLFALGKTILHDTLTQSKTL
ncbi:MAG: phosphotransferase [Bacteroidota bacterium]|nr:phosphotransferase [Bacteroidota bacterium]